MDHHSGALLLPFYFNTLFLSIMAYVYFLFCLAATVFISNIKDIESIKTAEQQLVAEVTSQARMSQLKTELMDTISHEARTPLAVLASYSGLVAMELKNKSGYERTVADLEKIVEEAKRVAGLIDGMNKFALHKSDVEKRTRLNLSELIEQTTELYRRIFERNNIELDLKMEDKLLAFASPEELTQVLFNLLQNAKNHTEQGKVSVIAKKENDSIVVVVSDTGTGIPSEMLPYLFERGVSGTKFGMGIGLSVCKEIIESLNGGITIETKLQSISNKYII